MPDHVVARMRDVESRLGVRPVEEINADRDRLASQIAPLWARYGPGGVWDAERKAKLSIISALKRAQFVKAEGPKPTEALLAEEAHASADYAGFIADALRDRDTLYRLEQEIESLDAEFRRAQSIISHQTAEARL